MRIDRSSSKSDSLTIIQSSSGWKMVDFKELKDYRDLFYFLVWRNIKARYAQTILGFSWAILNPLIQIVIFTVIFGKVAKIPTDGIPYFSFATAAIDPYADHLSSHLSSSRIHSAGIGTFLITGLAND